MGSGDLVAALRHVAAQPEVRAVEEAINPYLEQARDLGDPLAARDFFMRAALPAVHHHARTDKPVRKVGRYAFWYPAQSGHGAEVAEFLAHQDQVAMADEASPVERSTVFQRDDTVVRMVDMTVPPSKDPAAALGLAGAQAGEILARLVRTSPDLSDADGRRAALAAWALTPITDRRSPRS